MNKSFVETIENSQTGDFYYKIQHTSGLKIFVYPKKGSHSTYGIFGTKYGSVDVQFQTSENTVTKVPDGVAHFLEHKLFESEEGNAFERYAKTGACANAYTSFDMTCYLFSCTQNVYESLEILLDFVQSPYFTEETVQKEQGIIGQEIRMYEDDPQSRVMFNLLKAMYHTHPVKTDIAGTVESIAKITPKELYQCYNTFYNLHNMVLCVAGNVDVEKVLETADNMLKPCEPISVKRIFNDEPAEVVKHRVEQKMAVASPIFQIGFKENGGSNQNDEKSAAETDILLEILASDASPLFRRLLDSGLVNESSFSYEHFDGSNYGAVIFSGESKDPDAVAKAICAEADQLREKGIDTEAFLCAKKAVYGRNVSALNSAENIANGITALSFSGRELFTYINSIANVSLQDVQKRLETRILPQYCCLSVVSPINKN